MKSVTALVGTAVLAAVVGGSAAARADDGTATSKHTPANGSFSEVVAGLERRDGLVTVYLDPKGGRVLVALQPATGDAELGRFLYQVYLRAGLGSTPVGLDRSANGVTQIIAFHRSGKTVYAELENPAFRADRGDAAERAAVRESFASSLVWSSAVLAEGSDGRVLVDLSSFLTRDSIGVIDALAAAKQGDFHIDSNLTHADVGASAVFPENVELEAHQTFGSDKPGPEVRGIVPDPHVVTLVAHHSLIRLPAPGYQPRVADPRTGGISTLVSDYSMPLDAPIVYRLAHRFRLEKTDPGSPSSPVKKPIVFYVDRAAPEPVRSALVEGARWWAAAFAAAGFIDALRVEVLPEGVSPLDARYNVINWVHRQTRGWSYGDNIIDPRTGEIVKGTVLLGSQRMRQDRLIFEGLAGAAKTGSGAQDDPVRIALSRLRQLSVHETGHALGLEHNFAGSSYDDRASVMDYPSPRIAIKDGHLDFSDAYKVGIGSWDRFAIHWLYDEAAPGADQDAELRAIVADGYAHGQHFVADDDARPTRTGHPHGALWDDGADPVVELAHVLAVRRFALDRFGPGNLHTGAPLADLRRMLVPVYLFHRYEVDAVAKSIGGADFSYALVGDGVAPSTPVAPAEQRRSLQALLDTLKPDVLDLPDTLLNQLSAGGVYPRDPQYDQEVFGDPRASSFSLESAASASVDVSLGDLLDPVRLNRVLEQGERDPSQLNLAELLAATNGAVFGVRSGGTAHAAGLRRCVEARLIVHLATVLADKSLSPTAAIVIRAALVELGIRLANSKDVSAADLASARYYAQLLKDPTPDKLHAVVERDAGTAAPPPGMPIGAQGEDDWFASGTR